MSERSRALTPRSQSTELAGRKLSHAQVSPAKQALVGLSFALLTAEMAEAFILTNTSVFVMSLLIILAFAAFIEIVPRSKAASSRRQRPSLAAPDPLQS